MVSYHIVVPNWLRCPLCMPFQLPLVLDRYVFQLMRTKPSSKFLHKRQVPVSMHSYAAETKYALLECSDVQHTAIIILKYKRCLHAVFMGALQITVIICYKETAIKTCYISQHPCTAVLLDFVLQN